MAHQHDSIDRISHTLEPDQPVVLVQDWHHLLFLHWEIPVAELQALLPRRLTVDTFEGKAYIGLVPFTMTGVRPMLAPPLPWTTREAVLRRNQEIQRLWEQQRKPADARKAS